MIYEWNFLYTYRIRLMLVLFIMFSYNYQSIAYLGLGIESLIEVGSSTQEQSEETNKMSPSEREILELKDKIQKLRKERAELEISIKEFQENTKSKAKLYFFDLSNYSNFTTLNKSIEETESRLKELEAIQSQSQNVEDNLISSEVLSFELPSIIELPKESIEVITRHISTHGTNEGYEKISPIVNHNEGTLVIPLVNPLNSLNLVKARQRSEAAKNIFEQIYCNTDTINEAFPIPWAASQFTIKEDIFIKASIESLGGEIEKSIEFWQEASTSSKNFKIVSVDKYILGEDEIDSELINSFDECGLGNSIIRITIEWVDNQPVAIDLEVKPGLYVLLSFIFGLYYIKNSNGQASQLFGNKRSTTIEKKNLGKLLQKLQENTTDSEHRRRLLMLRSRYADLKHDWQSKEIKRDDYLIEKNQIRSSVIQLYSDVFDKLPNHIN